MQSSVQQGALARDATGARRQKRQQTSTGSVRLPDRSMTRHAFIAVYERKFDEAAPMLELAAGLARRGDSALSTRHWVSVVQAETFAGLGAFGACQQALDDADHVRELHRPVHNGGWLRFDGSRLAEERGTCS